MSRLADLLDAFRKLLLAALILALPLEFQFGEFGPQEGTYAFWYEAVTITLPIDILWVMFAVASLPVIVIVIRDRSYGWGFVFSGIFALLGLTAHLVTPLMLGASHVAHWFGAVAIVAVTARLSWRELRIFVVAPLLATAIVQTGIAFWQHPGPGAHSFYVGTIAVGRGMLWHQFSLALLLLFAVTVAVATSPRSGRLRTAWLVAIGIASAGIAVTMSRTVIVGLVVVGALYVWGIFVDRRTYGPALAAMALPFLGMAGVVSDGWILRAGNSSSGSVNARSSGRLQMTVAALEIIRAHPLVGLGPSGYRAEITRLNPDWPVWAQAPVHNVPLLAAAELGILAGVGYVVGLVAFGWRSLRTSPAAAAVFTSVAVFMMFERRTYHIPMAVAIVALWLAILDILADRRHSDTTDI